MRLCRFGDGRPWSGGRDTRSATSRPRSTCCPRRAIRFPTHDVVHRQPRRRDGARASAGAVRAGAAAGRAEAAEPGGQPRQDRRGAGELPEAPRRGAERRRRCTRTRPAHTLTIHTAGVFLKATSSLVGPGEGVVMRTADRRTDHEVELAFVIGRTASRVPKDEALSLRGRLLHRPRHHDPRHRGPQLPQVARTATACSGPWLVTADEIPDPGALDLEIAVNGETRQKSNTSAA